MARIAAAGALAAASPLGAGLGAQTLASRIEGVRDGTVQLAFATRPDVCGDGRGNTWTHGRGEGSAYYGRSVCITGPVEVSIGKSEGEIVRVRSCVACRPKSSSTTDADLGTVAPAEAARYLIGVARTLDGTSASAALAAASFADGVDVAPDLTRLVRDADARMQSRKDALFWLGQSETTSSQDLIGLYALLEPAALREQFTFVLSQRHDDAPALDKLIDIARHDADFKVRKQAMFWLGQSRDPKAIKFFQTILMR